MKNNVQCKKTFEGDDGFTCGHKPVPVREGEEWFFDESDSVLKHEDGRRIPFACPNLAAFLDGSFYFEAL